MHFYYCRFRNKDVVTKKTASLEEVEETPEEKQDSSSRNSEAAAGQEPREAANNSELERVATKYTEHDCSKEQKSDTISQSKLTIYSKTINLKPAGSCEDSVPDSIDPSISITKQSDHHCHQHQSVTALNTSESGALHAQRPLHTHSAECSPAERWHTALAKLSLIGQAGSDLPGTCVARARHKPYTGPYTGSNLTTASKVSHCDPTVDHSIHSLRHPSVHTYTGLRRKLIASTLEPTQDSEWILGFLSSNGLGLLLASLQQLCERSTGSFVDTVVQLECVGCVKAIMNSQVGLDYIIDNKEFTRKLASGM